MSSEFTTRATTHRNCEYWVTGNPNDGYEYWIATERGISYSLCSFPTVIEANRQCRSTIDILTKLIKIIGLDAEVNQ